MGFSACPQHYSNAFVINNLDYMFELLSLADRFVSWVPWTGHYQNFATRCNFLHIGPNLVLGTPNRLQLGRIAFPLISQGDTRIWRQRGGATFGPQCAEIRRLTEP